MGIPVYFKTLVSEYQDIFLKPKVLEGSDTSFLAFPLQLKNDNKFTNLVVDKDFKINCDDLDFVYFGTPIMFLTNQLPPPTHGKKIDKIYKKFPTIFPDIICGASLLLKVYSISSFNRGSSFAE